MVLGQSPGVAVADDVRPAVTDVGDVQSVTRQGDKIVALLTTPDLSDAQTLKAQTATAGAPPTSAAPASPKPSA